MTYFLGPAANVAVSALEDQGLFLPDKPDIEVPALPNNVADLSDEELMHGFSLLVAWTDYASTQAACAAVDERAAVNAADLQEARVLGHGAPKETVAMAKARALTDSQVISLRENAEKAHHYRKLVETIRDNLDRNYALFSRELTRRTSIDPRSRKDKYTT